MAEDNNDIVGEFEENYRGNSQNGLSFKQICLNNLDHVIRLGATEMNPRGIRTIETDSGQIEKITVNEIKIFSNAVDNLFILLEPQAIENQDILKEHFTELARLEKERKTKIEEHNKNMLGAIIENKSQIEDMERIKANLSIRFSEWEHHHIVKIARQKLRIMIFLLSKLNWLDEKIKF